MADAVTSSTSGAITFTGLGSGTDFDSLVTELIEIEEERITSLEEWKATWEEKIEAFQELNTAMLALQTTLEGMDSVGSFLTKVSTSGDTSVFTVTTDADADTTGHTVTVNQLATNKMMVTDSGYSSSSEDINDSSNSTVFAYSYMGTTYSVTVPATASLDDLANIVNMDGDNPGVKASVVNDGSSYYLQLYGMDQGSSATLTIDASTTLNNFSAADFETTQSNQNAELRVDGWPTSSWITRESNAVSDVITGVTLNLKGTGTTSVSTETDYDAVVENVQTFVDQVNEVRSLIISLTEFDDASEEGSLLTGNYGVQMISSNLNDITASCGLGFDYDLDTYCTLSQLGILTDAEEGSETAGLLELDTDELEEALENDVDAVALLFSAVNKGSTNSTDFSFSSCVETVTEPGTYELSYTMSGGSITSASINGNAATISGDTITGAPGTSESGLVVSVNNLADGTYSGNVYLKQGKTGQLIDSLEELTNDQTGPLAILEDNYDDIIDSIDEKIEYEERRIALKEERLREKYSRLDALLGTYDSIATQLESSIESLS